MPYTDVRGPVPVVVSDVFRAPSPCGSSPAALPCASTGHMADWENPSQDASMVVSDVIVAPEGPDVMVAPDVMEVLGVERVQSGPSHSTQKGTWRRNHKRAQLLSSIPPGGSIHKRTPPANRQG